MDLCYNTDDISFDPADDCGCQDVLHQDYTNVQLIATQDLN